MAGLVPGGGTGIRGRALTEGRGGSGILMWNGLSSPPERPVLHGCFGRAGPGVWRMIADEQATEPPVSRWSARSEARTNDLDTGVAAATRSPDGVSVESVLRRSSDVPAGRGSCLRHSHVRGSEPQCVYPQEVAPNLTRTGVARWQRIDGDLVCDGGWLARLVNPGHRGKRSAGWPGELGRHLRRSSRRRRTRRAPGRSR